MSDQLLRDLFQAYFDARKNKRSTINALIFELNFENEIFKLYREICERTYRLGRSICFVVFDPVQREIFASCFRDRVIHHLVYNYLNPLCENSFIKDSYACRKGKGTSFGTKRANHLIRACSQNYSRDCYILKIDIKSYFMSIDHKILYQKLSRIINSSKLSKDIKELTFWLLKKIIFHDYTKNCFIKGSLNNWHGLPRDKSLFNISCSKGLPIGNLTSQLFGNVYLNDFDHFIKRQKSFYYGRYVDDIILVYENKESLLKLLPVMRNYLNHFLCLKIHRHKVYLQHYSKGVNFLGAIIKPYHMHLRKRVKTNFYRCLRRLKVDKLQVCPMNDYTKNIFSMINSYLGNMSRYKTFRLRKRFAEHIESSPLHNFFKVEAGYRKITVRKKW